MCDAADTDVEWRAFARYVATTAKEVACRGCIVVYVLE